MRTFLVSEVPSGVNYVSSKAKLQTRSGLIIYFGRLEYGENLIFWHPPSISESIGALAERTHPSQSDAPHPACKAAP